MKNSVDGLKKRLEKQRKISVNLKLDQQQSPSQVNRKKIYRKTKRDSVICGTIVNGLRYM